MRDSLWQFLLLDLLLPCFIVTEVVECLAAWIYPKRNCKDLFLVFLVNVLTNPAAVFINFFVPFRITHPVLWILFSQKQEEKNDPVLLKNQFRCSKKRHILIQEQYVSV